MDTVNAFCGFESARSCYLCDDCSRALFRNDRDFIPEDKLDAIDDVIVHLMANELEYVPGHCWLDDLGSGTTCDCCGTTEYGWRSHALEVPFEG